MKSKIDEVKGIIQRSDTEVDFEVLMSEDHEFNQDGMIDAMFNHFQGCEVYVDNLPTGDQCYILHFEPRWGIRRSLVEYVFLKNDVAVPTHCLERVNENTIDLFSRGYKTHIRSICVENNRFHVWDMGISKVKTNQPLENCIRSATELKTFLMDFGCSPYEIDQHLDGVRPLKA